MSVFGENVKKIRTLHNLSQQEFGDLFGVSRGSVGSYEEGRAEPKIDTAIKIAQHFNISLDYLLTIVIKGNDLSNLTKVTTAVIEKVVSEPPKFIEERVADLEQKLKEIESRLNTENDN